MSVKSTLCIRHGTPLRETSDPLFASAVELTCEACDIYRQADARQAMAERDPDPKRKAKHLDIADRMRKKAYLLQGRWFEVKRGEGELWQMSERQIDAARKNGITVEVISQIV